MIIECLDWDRDISYCYKHLQPIENDNKICPKCLNDNLNRINITIELDDTIVEINSKIVIVSK